MRKLNMLVNLKRYEIGLNKYLYCNIDSFQSMGDTVLKKVFIAENESVDELDIGDHSYHMIYEPTCSNHLLFHENIYIFTNGDILKTYNENKCRCRKEKAPPEIFNNMVIIPINQDVVMPYDDRIKALC